MNQWAFQGLVFQHVFSPLLLFIFKKYSVILLPANNSWGGKMRFPPPPPPPRRWFLASTAPSKNRRRLVWLFLSQTKLQSAGNGGSWIIVRPFSSIATPLMQGIELVTLGRVTRAKMGRRKKGNIIIIFENEVITVLCCCLREMKRCCCAKKEEKGNKAALCDGLFTACGECRSVVVALFLTGLFPRVK